MENLHCLVGLPADLDGKAAVFAFLPDVADSVPAEEEEDRPAARPAS